ncbi:MAG TPA: hypothetical protein VFL79_04345 [Terriglobia bacterium]|nr:hypothetical protein [Terriglobia bacterium]
MKTKADCYGKMFPDVIHMIHNEAVTGKVFGYRVDQPGIGVTNRATTVNREEWQHCLECPEFDGCYWLSMGTMLMERAVKS